MTCSSLFASPYDSQFRPYQSVRFKKIDPLCICPPFIDPKMRARCTFHFFRCEGGLNLEVQVEAPDVRLRPQVEDLNNGDVCSSVLLLALSHL